MFFSIGTVSKYTLFAIFIIVISVSCSTNKVDIGQVADNYHYVPPFEKGKRHLVSQGFNGEKTHKGVLNRFAVDIVMPVGSKVCAARSGKVESLIETNENSQKFVEKDLSQMNYVKIRHSDETVAIYAHLKKGSVSVTRGQKVNLGQCFAQSGNSGFSTGPHLHFSILSRNRGGKSLPFNFVGKNGEHIIPKYLEWLYHY